jgi:hypothetical protein
VKEQRGVSISLPYVVRVEDESGRYYVMHTKFPGVEASGNSFYDCIEKFDLVLREQKVVKPARQIESRRMHNEMIVQTVAI